MDQLVTDAQSLARQGVEELILIAQDLNLFVSISTRSATSMSSWRVEYAEEVDSIACTMLSRAASPWRSWMSSARPEQRVQLLDMPLQHGSTEMLKRMRRGVTEKTETLVATIRESPGIAIRTTLIAGIPGETQADHDDSLRWIERMRFDRLGAFTYSHEEDTHAHTMADDVPDAVKQERAQKIDGVARWHQP